MTLNNSNPNDISLIELLDQQRMFCLRLAQLCQRQRSLMGGATAGPEVLAVVAQRQEALESLARINDRIEASPEGWKTLSHTLDPITRSRLGQLLEELQNLLDLILQDDRDDLATLSAGASETAVGADPTNRDNVGAIEPAPWKAQTSRSRP